jgi:hypothetical protein
VPCRGLWRSLVSALRSGRRGRRFKSGQPDSRRLPYSGVLPPHAGGLLAGTRATGIALIGAILARTVSGEVERHSRYVILLKCPMVTGPRRFGR